MVVSSTIVFYFVLRGSRELYHRSVLADCSPICNSLLMNTSLRKSVFVSRSLCKLLPSRLISFTNFNAQFLYSLTICMLHYNPRHVSSINMPIFRRTNFIITASGIVTLCKRLYYMPDESSLLSSCILYSRLQRVTIPDTVIIQFVLLKMGMLMLETCRGL
jgi:hypothetical protein